MPQEAPPQAMAPLRSRIAPTPSGFLHSGNGFSFVLTWLLVRSSGGVLSLRIDDADTQRARPDYIEDIFRCLHWLGLDWDEGPVSPDDFALNYSQVHRFERYQHLLDLLRSAGYVYACNCSRSQIRQSSISGIYQGHCRSRQRSFAVKENAWRVQVPDTDTCFKEAGRGSRCINLAAEMGDFVIRRKGGFPAYQIASLADDFVAGTNLLVRGEDLVYSSAAQQHLAQLLGQQQQDKQIQQQAGEFQQALFLHHPLLLDEKGEKLSKSAGSSSLRSLREAGGTPQPVYARVAAFLALPPEAATSLSTLLQELPASAVGQRLLAR